MSTHQHEYIGETPSTPLARSGRREKNPLCEPAKKTDQPAAARDSVTVGKRQHGATVAAFRPKWGLTDGAQRSAIVIGAGERQQQQQGDVMNRKVVIALACVALTGGFAVIAASAAVVISHLAGGLSASRRLATWLKRVPREVRPRHAAAVGEQET